MDYDVVKSDLLYKGKILKVFSDKVMMPNGNAATREIVVKNDAAAIVPVDEKGNIILVRQYRHPAKDMILEIPAGTFEFGEDPYDCAKRELEEEIGYKANSIVFVNWTYASVGICSEKIYLYIATDLVKTQQNLDEDEFLEIEKYPLEQAYKMVFDGTIRDSKTVMGILAYKEFVTKSEL